MKYWSLAEYLLREADQANEEDAEDFPVQMERRELFIRIVGLIMQSREGFTEENIGELERIASGIDNELVLGRVNTI